jgi:hypothetical protein
MKKCPCAIGRMAKKTAHAIRSLFRVKKRTGKQGAAHSHQKLQQHVEMLRRLPWLSKLDEEVFRQVMDGFEIRQFKEEAFLVREQDPDSGMFVIVTGTVRIEIRGIIMDTAGAGSLIGEMAVLTGYPRTASVIALSPVEVAWMESVTLKEIMKGSVELENSLWEFASTRFAMNLLGKREPFNQWEQNKFIQWLASGVVKLPNENGWIDLEGKVGVLVTGTAALYDGSTIVKSPSTLVGKDYIFSKEARVFLRDR